MMIKQVENEQVDLEALQCNPEDVIILRYNLEKTSVDRALQIHSVM